MPTPAAMQPVHRSLRPVPRLHVLYNLQPCSIIAAQTYDGSDHGPYDADAEHYLFFHCPHWNEQRESDACSTGRGPKNRCLEEVFIITRTNSI